MSEKKASPFQCKEKPVDPQPDDRLTVLVNKPGQYSVIYDAGPRGGPR
jgi:hypothetical protein